MTTESIIINTLVWKVERSKKYKEDMIPILSPHPPTRARDIQKQHSGPEEEHSESSGSVSKNVSLEQLIDFFVKYAVALGIICLSYKSTP